MLLGDFEDLDYENWKGASDVLAEQEGQDQEGSHLLHITQIADWRDGTKIQGHGGVRLFPSY